MFVSKFNDVNPLCVLMFKYQHVKADDSRKVKSSYFVGKVRCKFENCCKYQFSIATKPNQTSKEVIVNVNRFGIAQHSEDKICKRHLKGQRRNEVAKEVIKRGISGYHYDALGEITEEAVKSGNYTDCSSKSVLKQAVAEQQKKDWISDNDVEDLLRTKEIMKDLDTENKNNPGYIQEVSVDPFLLVTFTEDQIKILQSLFKLGKVNLYLDATGSVVRKVSQDRNKVFYYAVVVQLKDVQEPPLPIAEMITDDHSALSVTRFLGKFRHSCIKITGQTLQPDKIETDFSWPLITASLLVYNQENIARFLDRAYQILNGKYTHASITGFTVTHLCSYHMLRDVSRRLQKLKLSKDQYKLYMFCFALLQNSSSLMEATDIFQDIACLLQYDYTSNDTSSSLERLNRRIGFLPENPR